MLYKNVIKNLNVLFVLKPRVMVKVRTIRFNGFERTVVLSALQMQAATDINSSRQLDSFE